MTRNDIPTINSVEKRNGMLLNEIALEAQNWALPTSYNDGIGLRETFVVRAVLYCVEWWLLAKCVLLRWWF